MNKNIPNLISMSRIFLSLSLFFMEPMGTLFIIVYITAFLTDILDGNLARRTGTCSDLGKTLDSIGDVVYILTFVVILLPWMKPDLWILIAAGAVAVFRMTPAIVMLVVTGRYNTFHTKWSKATTALVFFTPFIYLLIGQYSLLIPMAFFIISGYYDYPLMHKYCKENSRY